MKTKILAAVVIALFSLFLPGVTRGAQKNVIIINNGGEDPLLALPLLDGTVIKFDNDSVFFSKGDWKSGYGKSEIASFRHDDSLESDFTVRVVTNTCHRYPLQGKYVTIHKEHDDDVFGLTQETDEEGVAVFENLPAGFYTLFVNDYGIRFESIAVSGVLHGYEDSREIIVKEKILNVDKINHIVETTDDEGWFDIWLDWEQEPETEGYRYAIFVNNEWYGETDDTFYILPHLPSGTYEIVILPISEYDNEATEGRKLLVNLGSETGISSPETEGNHDFSPYYNLNGQIVKNPGPGIYIHKGKKVVKQ